MQGIDLYQTFNIRPLDEATAKRAIDQLVQSAGLLYAEQDFVEEVQGLIRQYRSRELALRMKPWLDPEKA